MSEFFRHERFGGPQVAAAFLLLIFIAQCVWLIANTASAPATPDLFRVQEGLRQWRGEAIAGTPSMAREESGTLPPSWFESNRGYDPNHSPLWYLTSAAPFFIWPNPLPGGFPGYSPWLARLPFLLFGALLGASLWYVARRLYGNAGGYIALVLYCFSPEIIRSSSLMMSEPETLAAWGTFGAIFTAMALAHTLYAPREVVLWNWQRITLLGLSLALAIGAQFSLVIVLPVALGFMLYLAPARRSASFVIFAAAFGLAFLLLFASYFFHFDVFWNGLQHADFLHFSWRALRMKGDYQNAWDLLLRCGPALALALVPSLFAYGLWPRTRYFGNTAPLLVGVLFLALGLATPHYPGLGFQLMAVPFLMLFVAGMLADMMETRHRVLVVSCSWSILAASALWNILELVRIRFT